MLCAVNADQHEFVFHCQGGSFIRIEAHANLPREEIFDGQRARKISQGELVVQFNKQLRIGFGEKILPRNFARVDGAEGNGRLVAGGDQRLRGATDVSLPDEQVQVAVAAHCGIAIGLHGQHWPFDDQRADVLRGEQL